jgi:hypothetical protein
MQLVDRIEKRRFVGREFLLWLWFESELLDATLSTRAHGPFGLWLEKRLTLSAGKQSTRITAVSPGLGREAKEALLAGQLPESAGIRITWRDDETGFLLKAEQLAIAGLKLHTVLEKEPEDKNDLVEQLKGNAKGRKAKPKAADDAAYEEFFERMQLTQEFEALLEALYSDFIALRLSDLWSTEIVPRLRAWARGEQVDEAAYSALKKRGAKPVARAG